MIIAQKLLEVPIVLKRKSIRCNRIASVGYAENKDEKINRILSECSKQAQNEYKSRLNWVEKASHWELCKRFTF